MTASLVLHVGAMKTGTTYVQGLLAANADRLADAGWWVPPQRRVVRAVRELLAHAAGTSSASPRWTALVEDARAHGARGGRGTVVSMEFLSHARRRWMPTVAAGLEGLDLRVVLTARDAASAVPAQWQSLVRNGYPLSWPDFAAGVSISADRPDAPGAASFRRTQDVPRMLAVWGEVVEPGRLTVVTVPGPGSPRHLLWERVLTACGIDPALTSVEDAFDNPQLGYGSCEALRRVNATGLGQEPPPLYRRVTRRLAQQHLFELRRDETRALPDRALAAFAAAQNARTLAAVARHAHLVGDPHDLPDAVRGPGVADRPDEPPEAHVRRATSALLDGALAICAEQGLVLPSELTVPGPDDDAAAHALRTATVMGIAMTGEVSHRPSPRRSPATGR